VDARRSCLAAAFAVGCLAPPASAQSPARRGPLDVREEWLLAQQRLTLPALSPDPLARGASDLRVALDWGSDWAFVARRATSRTSSTGSIGRSRSRRAAASPSA